jgi:transposase
MLGQNDMDIERRIKVDHETVKKVRSEMLEGINPKLTSVKVGAPKKVNQEPRNCVNFITIRNYRMTNHQLAEILLQQSILPQVSTSTIERIRKDIGFEYLPPNHTFFLTEKQKVDRFNFANNHINDVWNSNLFTDESYFWLGHHQRRLYRKRNGAQNEY